MQTHLAIWWAQIENEWDSVLIFEDDAVLAKKAVQTIRETMELVPNDWDQVYFGGQHLDTNERAPEVAVQDKLCRCRNVNRTHAYAIRQGFAHEAIEAIDCQNNRNERLQHVDYLLGDLHDSHNVYSPWRFCVGQARGASDVNTIGRNRPRHTNEHWWNQYPIVDAAGVV